MSMRYKGGVLSATPPTVTISSAPGLWTMQDQMRYQAAGTWPPAILPDPYFGNVVALMHFDGTNGAQNNTFLDSSTNAFSITRNGNTTQGAFSPFSRADGGWSNYFDGSGDYLSVGATNTLNVGAGNFTIEGWFYMTSAPGAYVTLMSYTQASQTTGMRFGDGGFGTKLQVGLHLDSIGNVYSTAYTQSSFSNQWHHVAMTRQSGVVRFFVDGQQQNLGTGVNPSIYPLTDFTDTRSLGTSSTCEIAGTAFQGYVSGVRFIKDTALYTSSFTPPTTPLTAIANTSLLTCQSNRFKDNSTTASTITPVGNTSVQVFSPFNPTTAYSAASNGGSGYFDGNGDYLAVPDNAAFDMGTGNVTIEAWIYVTNIPSATAQGIFGNLNSGYEFYMYPYGAAGTISIGVQTFEGGYQQIYTITNNVRLNEWAHVAFTRASGTNRFFVNGALCSTTGTLTNPLNAGGTQEIGRRAYTSTDFFFGYMSSLRVVKGTAVYTAAFTPPTAPLTAISGTSLLCNFTNAGAFDNAAIEDYETVGSSQLSTTQFKFGTSSLILNGTGTNAQNTLRGATTSDNFRLGTGPFTVEGFLRLNSSSVSYPYIWSLYNPGTNVSVLTMFFGDAGFLHNLLIYHNNNLINVNNGASRQSAFLNTWKHFAFVRDSSSTFTVYVDGVSVYSANLSTDLGSSKLHFGNIGDGSTYGYLDEFRITKGVARYTANFAPPTDAFPNL